MITAPIVLMVTHSFDCFFGVFWGSALMGLNLFLHSIEIKSFLIEKKYNFVGNYFSRYLILALGFGMAGILSFDWLLGTMIGIFLYFPAVYIGSLKNIKIL
jgi:hypothetical protein